MNREGGKNAGVSRMLEMCKSGDLANVFDCMCVIF